MNIKALIAWCIAHPELAVVAAGALLSIPGAVYALVKTAYQAITGRPAKGPAWTVLDVVVEVLPNLPGAINRVVRGAGLPSIFAPPAASTPAPSKVPAPIDPSAGQRGSARVGTLLALCLAILVACGLGAALTGCPPVPPSDGGTPVVTPSGWSQTARLAVTVGRGLLPVAGAIVEATTQDPGRTQARRAFVVADDALAGLGRALDAYDARGGDRCAAYAAAGAAGVALAELADVLAANGIALGVPLGRVVDLVASVVDTLVPQCQLDAGFASAGRAANDRLLGIERAARSRGVILRRDLDAIEPRIDGGVR